MGLHNDSPSTWSLAMSGFGFVALVLESTQQRLYSTHHAGWGGTRAGNRTITASTKSRGSSWSEKLLKSMNNEILPFPWSSAYIIDWAAFFEHEFPSPSSASFSPSGVQGGAGGGGSACLWTERFNATYLLYTTAGGNARLQIGFRSTKGNNWHLLMQNPPDGKGLDQEGWTRGTYV